MKRKNNNKKQMVFIWKRTKPFLKPKRISYEKNEKLKAKQNKKSAQEYEINQDSYNNNVRKK
jgi:hypothetical protein